MVKISVIIPAYNRSLMLLQALHSLEQQTLSYADFEVIVVDNNSKDNTRVCIEDYARTTALQFSYVLETRQGDIYTRHTGAKLAKGNILYFTDDDATFDVNMLEEILKIFTIHPEVGALGTRIRVVWDEKEPEWIHQYENYLGRRSMQQSGMCISTKGLYLNNGSLAIRKDIFAQVRGNNPGQVGDYLIGDAEVGLCFKMHQLGIPLAFTDDVTMWHHQVVARNATKRDVRRRVRNIGISDAYSDLFTLHNRRVRETVISIMRTVPAWVKNVLLGNPERSMNASLAILRYCTRLEYYWRYRHDKALMAAMSNRDWLFDDNYVTPSVIYCSTNDNAGE